VPFPNIVRITGTTSGRIEVGPFCLRFGSAHSAVTETVVLTDRDGLRSNTLKRTFPRPRGVPEGRQPGGEPPSPAATDTDAVGLAAQAPAAAP